MLYDYIKALHIIFIVTWFAGLFYIVRLYIYNTEAGEKPEPERTILRNQLNIMIRRLWFGITWPSAVLTLIFGPWMWYLRYNGFSRPEQWLEIKLCFVIGLYVYHFTLHRMYADEKKGIFKYTSTQLRIWNEVATIFLISIVMLAVVKQGMSLIYGVGGLILFIILLMSAIRIYKLIRTRSKS